MRKLRAIPQKYQQLVSVSGVIAFCGPSLDPYLAGALASLPVLGAAAAMAEHARGVRPTQFWRGYVTGLLAKAGFGAAFAALVVVWHPAPALLGAALLAGVASLGGKRWLELSDASAAGRRQLTFGTRRTSSPESAR